MSHGKLTPKTILIGVVLILGVSVVGVVAAETLVKSNDIKDGINTSYGVAYNSNIDGYYTALKVNDGGTTTRELMRHNSTGARELTLSTGEYRFAVTPKSGTVVATTIRGTGGDTGYVRVFESDGTLQYENSDSSIYGVGINDDGSRVVYGSFDQTTIVDPTGSGVCSTGAVAISGSIGYEASTNSFIGNDFVNDGPITQVDADDCSVGNTWSVLNSNDPTYIATDSGDALAFAGASGSGTLYKLNASSGGQTSWSTGKSDITGIETVPQKDYVFVVAGDGTVIGYDYNGTQITSFDSGGADAFRDIGLNNEGTTSELLVYDGTALGTLDLYDTGTTTLTTSVSGTVTDQSGNAIPDATVSDGHGNTTTTDANGDYSLTLPDDSYQITASKRGYANQSATVTIDGGDETQDFTLGPSSPPYVDAAGPIRGQYVIDTDRNIELVARVDDDSGDTINATIYKNELDGQGFSQVNSVTNVQPGSWVNTTVAAGPGENQWRVELDDGVTTRNTTFSYNIGSNLLVFNGTDLSKLQNRQVTVDLASVDSGFTDTKTTSDGILELTAVPRERLRATVNAPDYAPTTVVIDDPARVTGVVLYPDANANFANGDLTYEQCFSLEDKTGEYPQATTVVGARQAINGSDRIVSADFFGASNEAILTLKDGELYELVVANEEGDTKVLGQFQANNSATECTTLTIESTTDDDTEDSSEVIRGNVSNVSYAWDVYRTDPESGQPDIKFQFDIKNDTRQTDRFRLRIYEYQNQSNEPVNTSLGVINSIEYTYRLNSQEANKTWVVAWNATLDGEVISGSRILGAKQMPLGIPIDTKWKGWISAMGLVLVSGLFGGVRAKEGAIVIPLIAGILWYIDWLHPETGILAILGGLAVGVIIVYGTEEPTP